MKLLVFTICFLSYASVSMAAEVCGVIKSISGNGVYQLVFADGETKLTASAHPFLTYALAAAFANGTNICISTEPYQDRLVINKIRKP